MVYINKLKNIFEKKRNRRGRKDGLARKIGKRGSCQYLNSLVKADINQEYIVKAVETNNDEMKDFLFTLGCYKGEIITLISILSDQYIIVVKDARYSIDKSLASCIII